MWRLFNNAQDFDAAKLSANRCVGCKVCAFIDFFIVTGRDDNNEAETCVSQIYNLL